MNSDRLNLSNRQQCTFTCACADADMHAHSSQGFNPYLETQAWLKSLRLKYILWRFSDQILLDYFHMALCHCMLMQCSKNVLKWVKVCKGYYKVLNMSIALAKFKHFFGAHIHYLCHFDDTCVAVSLLFPFIILLKVKTQQIWFSCGFSLVYMFKLEFCFLYSLKLLSVCFASLSPSLFETCNCSFFVELSLCGLCISTASQSRWI